MEKEWERTMKKALKAKSDKFWEETDTAQGEAKRDFNELKENSSNINSLSFLKKAC